MSSSNDIRNSAFSISSTLALFWLSITSILKAVAQLSRLSDVKDLKRYNLLLLGTNTMMQIGNNVNI